MITFPDDIPNDKLPTVGIIIANFNYGQYVVESIESALKQTYPKVVVMVVDDMSTDDSDEKIMSVYKSHNVEPDVHDNEPLFTLKYGDVNGKDLLYIKMKKHVNVSAARNIAIELALAKADYYMVLDADDVAHEDKTTELAAALFMSTNIGAAYADYNILNVETGTTTPEFKEPFDKKRLMQECIVHSGAMMTKKALVDCRDEFGYYDANMRTCEDYDLWMRISEKYMIVHVPKLLSLVRVHKKNSTSVVPRQEWEHNWKRIVEKMNVRHGKTGL